jgi:hypothetical protein
MALLDVDWETYEIYIPQSYLTLSGGTLYTMDTDQFRLDLKETESSVFGIPHPKTHNHNTSVTIVGVTYSRFIEILPPYTITFEDGQYSVILNGSNNNIWDIAGGVLNQNQVQVIPTNSAGLQIVSTGSGLSTEQNDKLMSLDDAEDTADAVWADDNALTSADIWSDPNATTATVVLLQCLTALEAALGTPLTQLDAAPGPTASTTEILQWLFALSKNALETTATEHRVKNDSGTVIAEADLSDDGTTFTRSKFRDPD